MNSKKDEELDQPTSHEVLPPSDGKISMETLKMIVDLQSSEPTALKNYFEVIKEEQRLESRDLSLREQRLEIERDEMFFSGSWRPAVVIICLQMIPGLLKEEQKLFAGALLFFAMASTISSHMVRKALSNFFKRFG